MRPKITNMICRCVINGFDADGASMPDGPDAPDALAPALPAPDDAADEPGIAAFVGSGEALRKGPKASSRAKLLRGIRRSKKNLAARESGVSGRG